MQRIDFHSKKQYLFKGLSLSCLPIRFTDWENNIELLEFVFNLFVDGFYVVQSDSTRVDNEDIKSKLDYYHSLRDTFIEAGQLNFSKVFFQNTAL